MKANKAPVPGQIVSSIPWQPNALVVRYPQSTDWKSAWSYINRLSNEHTYILMQGNRVTQTQEKAFVSSLLTQMKTGLGVHLFLVDGSEIIGSAGITLKRFAEKHVGVLGLSVAPQYRDGGVGTRYLEILLTESKRRLSEMSIVVLEVFGNNPRARHVYEKVGFKEYGRLPKGLIRNGETIDAINMYLPI